MDTKSALAALFIALLIIGAVLYAMYRLGYLNLAALATATTATSSSSDTASSTSGGSSNSGSSSGSSIFNATISNIENTFGGFVNYFREFVSNIARNIASGGRLDIIVNASVYAIIFIVVGLLAEMLVKIIKYVCFGLAAVSIVVAVLALLGLL